MFMLGSRDAEKNEIHVWRWRLQSGVRWTVRVGAFGRNLDSFGVNTFPQLISFIITFYKRTFSAIYKDNAAINYTTLRQEKDSFP
jgi:hypothetical protein